MIRIVCNSQKRELLLNKIQPFCCWLSSGGYVWGGTTSSKKGAVMHGRHAEKNLLDLSLSLSSSLNKDTEALYDKYNVSLILSSESTSPFHVLFFYWSIKSVRAYAQLHTKCSAPTPKEQKKKKKEFSSCIAYCVL